LACAKNFINFFQVIAQASTQISCLFLLKNF